MCQCGDIGLDTLYCGKWRKISKSRRDLDLDQTMPNVELVQAISIYSVLQYVQVSSGRIRVLYTIIVVDKPQL